MVANKLAYIIVLKWNNVKMLRWNDALHIREIRGASREIAGDAKQYTRGWVLR